MHEIKYALQNLIDEITDQLNDEISNYDFNKISNQIYFLNLLTHKVVVFDRDEDKYFKNPLKNNKMVDRQEKTEPVYLPLNELDIFLSYDCFRIIICGD